MSRNASLRNRNLHIAAIGCGYLETGACSRGKAHSNLFVVAVSSHIKLLISTGQAQICICTRTQSLMGPSHHDD